MGVGHRTHIEDNTKGNNVKRTMLLCTVKNKKLKPEQTKSYFGFITVMSHEIFGWHSVYN